MMVLVQRTSKLGEHTCATPASQQQVCMPIEATQRHIYPSRRRDEWWFLAMNHWFNRWHVSLSDKSVWAIYLLADGRFPVSPPTDLTLLEQQVHMPLKAHWRYFWHAGAPFLYSREFLPPRVGGWVLKLLPLFWALHLLRIVVLLSLNFVSWRRLGWVLGVNCPVVSARSCI